jgi:hypothetical protein
MTPTLIPSLAVLAAGIALADSGQAQGRQETHPFVDLAEGHGRDFPGTLCTLGQEPVQLGGVGHQLVGAVPKRRNELHHHLGEVNLQVAVHLALVLGFKVRYGLAREGGIDGQQVGDARLFLEVKTDLGAGVGDG